MGYWGPEMMWGLGYGGWRWMGPVFMLVFWALLLAGGVLLVRYLVRQGRAGDRQESALEILKRRYARGEIDKDEYEAKRKDLT
jgi:putative membrane protein